jgi:hypothetical protein
MRTFGDNGGLIRRSDPAFSGVGKVPGFNSVRDEPGYIAKSAQSSIAFQRGRSSQVFMETSLRPVKNFGQTLQQETGNKSKRGGADRALIALSEPYEVRYWSKKFKVTPARLKAAVKAAGHSSKKVGAYLAKKSSAKKRKTKRTRA